MVRLSAPKTPRGFVARLAGERGTIAARIARYRRARMPWPL